MGDAPSRRRDLRAGVLAWLLCLPLFGVPSGLPSPFCYAACVWLPLSGLAAVRIWALLAGRPIRRPDGAAFGALVGASVALAGFALHVAIEGLAPLRVAEVEGLPDAAAAFLDQMGRAPYGMLLALLAAAQAVLGAALGAVGGVWGTISGTMKSEQ